MGGCNSGMKNRYSFNRVKDIHGDGISPHGKYSYGYASSQGRREHMEDVYEARTGTVSGQLVGFFAVYDGHGGKRAAEYVKDNLYNIIVGHPSFFPDTRTALEEAYNKMDEELLSTNIVQDGSTASTVVIFQNRFFVAHIGDSRVVISHRNKPGGSIAKALTRDHRPDLTEERQRIEAAGGQVTFKGTWRINDKIAISRSFGDRHLKQFVIPDPDIVEEAIDESIEFIIIASDGLWDTLSNQEAVEIVKSREDNMKEAALLLVKHAFDYGSYDNITCVVVRFYH
ncbi:Protein phosphatase 2C family protein [Rhynchospora pubera]|uniref:protein-serine/threonine phosphatase n=1 Tax=Rhynchospora pubera TaxID=906938 RepID=A0AAV8HSI9_9POAL|nr:Protein phosphatase 2C family protein [Rhynchospora pubera]KAJ4765130.1 Protein phosphatase 2C family protein [Rhynchospora pubera]KAJ4794009.1 Protein phosphatase 2C family protein [Rhynchospora pubera]KAJ4817847.1 Protein phosphatase 2C family protein [Rhynchospora pubera]